MSMVSLAVPRFPMAQTPARGPGDPNGYARLTRKEAQLLAVLQQNEGHCVSREFLLDAIWGYQAGTRTRTLDVHIQRLRRKLGRQGGSRIATILRSGYMWCSDGVAEPIFRARQAGQ